MKIIKKGIPPKPKIPDWVGKHLTCPKCRSVIELEYGDWIIGNLDNSRSVQCSVCYKLITWDRK